MKRLILVVFVFVAAVGYSQTLSEKTNVVSVDFRDQKELARLEAERLAAEKLAALKLAEEGMRTSATRKYRALVIGVSNYTYAGAGLRSLPNPMKDATALRDVLVDKYTFDSADVHLLIDPTRSQMVDAFEALADETQVTDNVLIFYAGHGYWDKEKKLGFWLPSDSKAESRGTWMTNGEIRDYISDKAIKSKHTLLITDACFGGSIFEATREVTAQNFARVFDLYKDASRRAITSGSLKPVPDESIFLKQLLKKLVENDTDYLPASQLYARIYEPVVANSDDTPQYGVIQNAGHEGGDFIFVRKGTH